MTFLENLRKSLTPEQLTLIQDALGDDFDWDLVPRSRLNKVIKQRNELREQLAGKSQPQNSISADTNESDDINFTSADTSKIVNIEELKKQWQQQQDEAVQAVKIQYAALEQLRAANAIDAELIWNANVFDKTKLTLDATGALVGMDDILTNLKKNKAHLFKTEDRNGAPTGTGKDGGDPFKGVATKEDFLKLSADKQFAFKEANPTLFKHFLQE